ncbi:unnamed protein product [Periconia digitata]|uniref:Chitin synthase n=1 Tax=Periconia digitata TaxID=1303443 RepID=A0A9W4U8A3_9PLEO|nr:unnamed protein product [Periconia digitata]
MISPLLSIGVAFAQSSVVFAQMSQVVYDGMFIYCILNEFAYQDTKIRSVHFSVLSIYLLYRFVSIFGASVFFLPIDLLEGRLWKAALVVNLLFYLPFRLTSWICCGRRWLEDHDDIRLNSRGVVPKQTHQNRLIHGPILVIIPCHKEPLDIIVASLTSVFATQYPNLHVFVSFDGSENKEAFSGLAKKFEATFQDRFPYACAEARVNGTMLTLLLFGHGGKPQCQKNTLDHIMSVHSKLVVEETYALFLDSDTTIPKYALSLLAERVFVPSSGMTDVAALSLVQGVENASSSFLSALQETEYLDYGIHVEVVMSSLGNVTCLSGTTMFLRLNVALDVFDTLLKEKALHKTLHHHWKYHYGDDRLLTLLTERKAGSRCSDIHTGIICNTQPALPMMNLVIQRRRWFLGAVATDAAALCDPSYWLTTPILARYRLLNHAAQTTDSQIICLAILITLGNLEEYRWVVGVVIISMGMNMLSLFCFASVRRRSVVVWYMYPIFLILAPMFNIVVKIFTIATVRDRKWGGVRGLPMVISKGRQ